MLFRDICHISEIIYDILSQLKVSWENTGTHARTKPNSLQHRTNREEKKLWENTDVLGSGRHELIIKLCLRQKENPCSFSTREIILLQRLAHKDTVDVFGINASTGSGLHQSAWALRWWSAIPRRAVKVIFHFFPFSAIDDVQELQKIIAIINNVPGKSDTQLFLFCFEYKPRVPFRQRDRRPSSSLRTPCASCRTALSWKAGPACWRMPAVHIAW